MQSTKYYQPYFLEDKSGRLTGSEFVDIHERMKFSYRCTREDAQGTQYCIHELTSPRDDASPERVVTLDFNANNTLGMISYGSKYIVMENYLYKVTPPGTLFYDGNTRYRTFTGLDGRRYRWSYRTHEDHEWTCVDSDDNVVAFYHLKIAGEPPYPGSSGCMLTVEEAYGDMACEFLATSIIMRHIAYYGIS